MSTFSQIVITLVFANFLRMWFIYLKEEWEYKKQRRKYLQHRTEYKVK